MPKTATLNNFAANQGKSLSEAATVTDIMISNITNARCHVSLYLDVGDGITYAFKDLQLPPNTTMQLENFQFQTSRGKLGIQTDTNDSINVVYTLL